MAPPQPPRPGRGDTAAAVIKALKEAPGPQTIAALSDDLGVHPNTVRFHLDRLAADGLVERATAPDRHDRGRPAALYRPAGGMDPAGPRRYRLLAEILTAGMDADGRAVEAGRAWGRNSEGDGDLPPKDRLTALLRAIGFAPETGDDEITLRHCPFLELAESRPAVVCDIHLGLMRGALESWNAPITVDRLDPFAEPDRCIAHLARTAS